jgi:hypothetical protein
MNVEDRPLLKRHKQHPSKVCEISEKHFTQDRTELERTFLKKMELQSCLRVTREATKML